jgi:hypothetical protein
VHALSPVGDNGDQIWLSWWQPVSSLLRYFIDRSTERYKMIVSRAGVESGGAVCGRGVQWF